MKNYEEMARCVLEARDGHINKKKIRQAKIKKFAPVVSCFCLAVLLGFGVRHSMSGLSNIPYQSGITETTMEQTEPTIESVMIDPTGTEPVKTEPETPPPTESWGEQPIAAEIPSTSVPDEDPNTNPNPLHWNEMTINQQYNMAEFGEPLAFYHTAEKEATADQIGDFICTAYMSGYDFYSDTYYHCDAEAYKIKNDEGTVIAIKFDGDDKFYLYNLTVPNQNQETDG